MRCTEGIVDCRQHWDIHMDNRGLDFVADGSIAVEQAAQVQGCCHHCPAYLADQRHFAVEDEKWHIDLESLVLMCQSHWRYAGHHEHKPRSNCMRHVHSKRNSRSARWWLRFDWVLGWRR